MTKLERRYVIGVEGGQNGENYSAHSPDVLGCVATADTLGQTIDLMQEAIEFHLEGMMMQGEEIPDSSDGITICVNVTVPQVSST
jgi:predicted RNase H-like HicB family nuclease